MRNISDFYRPQDSGSGHYRRRRGGGKIVLAVAVVLVLGAGWFWPQQSGRLVGKTIQATANVWDKVVHRDSSSQDQGLPDIDAKAVVAPEGNSDVMALPVSGVVVRNFVAVDNSGEARYDGVDIKSTPGQAVNAAASGVVLQTTETDGAYLVIVQHSDGIETRYGGLASATVAAGDTVALGDLIGKAGEEAVYFAIYQNGEPLDPLSHLQESLANE